MTEDVKTENPGGMVVSDLDGSKLRRVLEHSITVRLSDEDLARFEIVHAGMNSNAAELGMRPLSKGDVLRTLITLKHREWTEGK